MQGHFENKLNGDTFWSWISDFDPPGAFLNSAKG